eukprot:CAMPEP_0114557618 /NCGR_PEP_ID=MMETSP0114-20121206/9930_1 /TAXON_ID=31324 /ORGANISM="Goniomonas sp, Strain m" /LENGTH=351 /DNA_ID=CAMNT_0001742925 /DNA_START=23 /DNA_END=1078 /DNA_ORIENTATION=+
MPTSAFDDDSLQEELQEDLAELEKMRGGNALLSLENSLLQTHLDRVAPKMVLQQEEEQDSKNRKLRRQKNRGPEELTMEQKIDIAASEVDEAKKEIEERKEKGDRLLDDLKAFTEEAEVKIAELRKEKYEFNRDVINATQGGKPMAEKVIRWMEDRQRVKETVTDKLTLKNQQLRVIIQKQETQLHQKEEMGEVLHVIDFDQLKIENQQYLKKIEERNNELLKLKLTTGNIVQVLNSSKRKLSSVVSDSVMLRNMILEKEDLLKRVLEEVEKVELDKKVARRLNAKISKQIDESAMPQVMEYLKQKVEAFELEREVKNMWRKIEIAEMELKRYKLAALSAVREDMAMNGDY